MIIDHLFKTICVQETSAELRMLASLSILMQFVFATSSDESTCPVGEFDGCTAANDCTDCNAEEYNLMGCKYCNLEIGDPRYQNVDGDNSPSS